MTLLLIGRFFIPRRRWWKYCSPKSVVSLFVLEYLILKPQAPNEHCWLKSHQDGRQIILNKRVARFHISSIPEILAPAAKISPLPPVVPVACCLAHSGSELIDFIASLSAGMCWVLIIRRGAGFFFIWKFCKLFTWVISLVFVQSWWRAIVASTTSGLSLGFLVLIILIMTLFVWPLPK